MHPVVILPPRVQIQAEARRRFNSFLSPFFASATFNSISVYAAPISGVMAGEIFLRLGDVGVDIDEWPRGSSTPEASSVSDITRFVCFIRLPRELDGLRETRGFEVTFLGGCCKNR